MIDVQDNLYLLTPGTAHQRGEWRELTGEERSAFSWKVTQDIDEIGNRAASCPELAEAVTFLASAARLLLGQLSPQTEIWTAETNGKPDIAIGRRFQFDDNQLLELEELIREGLYSAFEDGPPQSFDPAAVEDLVRQGLVEQGFARIGAHGGILFDSLAQHWELSELVVPLVERWANQWREQIMSTAISGQQMAELLQSAGIDDRLLLDGTLQQLGLSPLLDLLIGITPEGAKDLAGDIQNRLEDAPGLKSPQLTRLMDALNEPAAQLE